MFVRTLIANAKTTLAVTAVLTLVAILGAINLKLDADLARLLPEHAESVAGLKELEAEYGGVARATVVLRGEQAAVEAAVDELAVALPKLENVRAVEAYRPVDFFQANRLLYLDLADLEAVSDRIQTRITWEKKQRNPLFASVKDEDPPSVDFEDIEAKYPDAGSKYIRADDGSMYVIFTQPDFPMTDMKRSGPYFEKLDRLVNEVVPEDSGVSVAYTGMYKRQLDQQEALRADLSRATLLAIVVLAIFLTAWMRGPRQAFLVIVPLIVGTIWAFAWAWLTFSTLNILTGFCGAVLLGLGVDYGIHLVSRYFESRAEGLDRVAAMEETFSTAGKASFYAGLTTAVALGSLAVSEFRAFYEFGIVALGGLLLILAAYATVLPALIALFEGDGEPRVAVSGTLGEIFADVWDRGRVKGVIALVVVALLAAAALGSTKVRYEYSLRKILGSEIESVLLDNEIDEAIGMNQYAAVYLAESREHARAVKAEVERRVAEDGGDAWVDRVLVVDDFLPRDQDAKIAILEQLRSKISARVKDERLLELRDELDATLAIAPVEVDELPETIQNSFRRTDGSVGNLVVVLPTGVPENANRAKAFSRYIRDLPGATPDAPKKDAATEALLLVDILRMIADDMKLIVAITVSSLFLLALFAFRRLSDAVITMVIVGVSSAAAIGICGLAGVSFNFINSLVVPIWLGLGVDTVFHLLVQRRERRKKRLFFATTFAVAAAFLTSMIGFGSMMTTGHHGLWSLGAAATFGLSTIFVVGAGTLALWTTRE